MGCQDELLIERVCEMYDQISKLDNLHPSKQVNSLFTQLVLICMPQCCIDIDRLSERVQGIRSKLIKLCGQAEGLLESHYSSLIGGSYGNPVDHIGVFPYYSNYLKLSQLEFSLLSNSCSEIPSTVAFVGSGPLPLSSIILATNHLRTTRFHNYDMDSSANSKALQLVSSDPDLSKRMFFHTANVLSLKSLRQYEVVFLAALVGMDKKEKGQIINHLAKHMAPGALLLLRSAHGARAFLYPVVDPRSLQGFEVLSVFHPVDEVINSVIVARKCTRPINSFNQGLNSPPGEVNALT